MTLREQLEQVKTDRSRLLEILRELSVQLDLRKDELEEMIERAKKDDDLPEDFHLGLLHPEAKK